MYTARGAIPQAVPVLLDRMREPSRPSERPRRSPRRRCRSCRSARQAPRSRSRRSGRADSRSRMIARNSSSTARADRAEHVEHDRRRAGRWSRRRGARTPGCAGSPADGCRSLRAATPPDCTSRIIWRARSAGRAVQRPAEHGEPGQLDQVRVGPRARRDPGRQRRRRHLVVGQQHQRRVEELDQPRLRGWATTGATSGRPRTQRRRPRAPTTGRPRASSPRSCVLRRATASGRRSSRNGSVAGSRRPPPAADPSPAGRRRRPSRAARSRPSAAGASNAVRSRVPCHSHDATSSNVALGHRVSHVPPAVGEHARGIEHREIGLDDHFEPTGPSTAVPLTAASRSTSARRNRLRRLPGIRSLWIDAAAHVRVQRLGFHAEPLHCGLRRHPWISPCCTIHTLMQSILTG